MQIFQCPDDQICLPAFRTGRWVGVCLRKCDYSQFSSSHLLTWIYSLYITSRHSKLSKRKQAFCLLCPTNDFIITLCFLHKILITYYDSRSCDYLLYRTPCPEKDDTELWVLTLTIPNRFSYLFHWQILHCSTDLTMSCTCSYTTLSENKRELKAIRYWAPCLIHGVRPRPLLMVNSDDMTSNVCCW